jgi:hypothetical protein
VKNILCKASVALFVLLLTAAAYAEKRPHEGKITRISQGDMIMTVQGEKGDTWDLSWTETTKLKHNLTFEELRPGDSVHFDFVEKDGKRFITELRRTGRASY